ncbi:NADP-dependent oxidoreductase [Mucilaginibacter sp. SG564]|uniref:NADP-dependent oxidoreductase n=1 Tax=Mucilaginibacter sp. SG564 TaxID=2587022 RepID=UPI001556707C|nr:NADP-dependent oxidoreductase [Mucilaginibacter sp. SG564]NOW95923.1 NADPH:quinone reductase-like Zn-dependent oxidoreductase [Mucilaginibacter sp. SG564]
MKAIIIKEFGAPSVLTLTDVETPVAGNEEVLVEVKAVSINPVDVKTRAGSGIAGRLKDLMPIILGWDISGRVVTSDSEKFKVGDDVFGMINFPGYGKAYSTYVNVPASQLALKPSTISHEEAAAATLAALTAYQVLVHHAKIKKGSRVLVHAGSGGVGHFGVQIAKHLGAYVITTSSAANKEFVMTLGADEHIDYKSQKFEEVTSNIDFVFDTVGGENIIRSLEVIKDGGRLISIPTYISEEAARIAKSRNITAHFELVYSDGKDMEQIAKLLEQKIVIPHLDTVFAFEDMAKAHALLETGHTVGKIVLTL